MQFRTASKTASKFENDAEQLHQNKQQHQPMLIPAKTASPNCIAKQHRNCINRDAVPMQFRTASKLHQHQCRFVPTRLRLAENCSWLWRCTELRAVSAGSLSWDDETVAGRRNRLESSREEVERRPRRKHLRLTEIGSNDAFASIDDPDTLLKL